MSIVPKNDQSSKARGGRRRQKKKRRTEDFSDSSSSDSSSDSENEKEPSDLENNNTIIEDQEDGDVVFSDIEGEVNNAEGENFEITKSKLQSINLTKTQLNETSKNINIGSVNEKLRKDRASLNNDYLGLMFENYGDEINTLRSAPDFNDRSISILANTLKNGSNIFDEDTLKAIVSK